MSKQKGSKHTLGVMITGRAVHAALLESGTDELKVIRRFMRQRTSRFSAAQTALPDLQDNNEGIEFPVQFSESGSGGMDNMFLGSEFGGLDIGRTDEFGDPKDQSSTFVLELGDILAECRDAGYPEPVLAFAGASSEVNQIELAYARGGAKTPPTADQGSKKKSPKAARRGELLEMLTTQHKGAIDEDTVAFLPMTPNEDGLQRYLAVFPKANDPVASTLRTMREQQGRRMPPIRLFDTEVPLYLGLARATRNMVPQKPRRATDAFEDAAPVATGDANNTLIVRAGAEDTLVLFLSDDTLQQSENLRSLTAYEAPETICSRVLLLQDEYGIGEVQHVLLLSEEREDDLIESFEMFFPDARVESMRQYVPELDDEYAADAAAGALLPAVAVGLRLSDDARYKGMFEDVNLLPKQLLRRRITLPVTWHVLALYAVLFCTVLFFVARYFTLENQIAGHQRNIQSFQEEHGPVSLDAKTLQSKIDSLEAVHSQYMRAINVLEGLLQGSDKWSRALENVSTEVSEVTGVWIESWNPRAGTIEVTGNATARDNVVALAERLKGNISSVTFSEIREWPVYSFKMNVPLEQGLPKAAQYLRQQVANAEKEAAENVPITSAALDEQQ